MSSKDLIKTTNEFYDLNERLLMLTGLWPYQEKFEKFFRTCIVNVSLLLALLFEVNIMAFYKRVEIRNDFISRFIHFLFQFYRFYTYVFDMKSIVEEFQIFIPLLSGSYCYYNSFFHFELVCIAKKYYVNYVDEIMRMRRKMEMFR